MEPYLTQTFIRLENAVPLRLADTRMPMLARFAIDLLVGRAKKEKRDSGREREREREKRSIMKFPHLLFNRRKQKKTVAKEHENVNKTEAALLLFLLPSYLW
jgi:DNA-binding response OmpR family regulator